MWQHYSCTMVTTLLICVAKSGGQGPDSDWTLFPFLTNLPTILMLAPTWELSAWSHDSHVAFCIRRAFWTAVRAVRRSEVEVFLARLESSQRITWRQGFGNVRNMHLLWTIGNTMEESEEP